MSMSTHQRHRQQSYLNAPNLHNFVISAATASAMLLGSVTLALAGPETGSGQPHILQGDPARLRTQPSDGQTADLRLPWLRRDDDSNPPGPRGGRGTNWENPPGPRGGPGISPDPIPWPLARLRNWLAEHTRPDPASLERPHRPERLHRPDRPDPFPPSVSRPGWPGAIADPKAVSGLRPAPAYRAPAYRAATAGRRR